MWLTDILHGRIFLHEDANQIAKMRSKFGLDTVSSGELPNGIKIIFFKFWHLFQ